MSLFSHSVGSYCGIFLYLLVFITGTHGACNNPPKLQYGKLKSDYTNQSIFSENVEVQYVCRPGHVRVPGISTSITCLADSTWSTPKEFCKKRSCGNPGEIPNGKLHATDFLFGSRVNYTCIPGYKMISKRPFRDCRTDGNWSNAVPECKGVPQSIPPSVTPNTKKNTCDEMWAAQEAIRKCTSTPEDWKKYLEVQYLYLQIENLKLDIERKKEALIDRKL